MVIGHERSLGHCSQALNCHISIQRVEKIDLLYQWAKEQGCINRTS